MKKLAYCGLIIIGLLAALVVIVPADNGPAAGPGATPSPVYFTRDISGAGVLKAFGKIEDQVRGPVAVKVHFGEEGNDYYLKPELVKTLVQKLKATLVETNVLYSGRRHQTASHLELAREHGFGFANIDILDSAGERIYACDLPQYSRVRAGGHLDRYQTIVLFSHFKGHGLAGFGGAIKNVSMGLASVPGKLALHANIVPEYDTSKCIRCGVCVAQCQGKAISINPLSIDTRKCIGCGQCIQICPVKSFAAPKRGKISTDQFNRRLVEYAKVLSDSNHFLYVIVLKNISPDCDCKSGARSPFVHDIGILASTDIVAIEKASHDLVDKACHCDDAFLKENSVSGKMQIEYAWQLGMGSKEYVLINVDK